MDSFPSISDIIQQDEHQIILIGHSDQIFRKKVFVCNLVKIVGLHISQCYQANLLSGCIQTKIFDQGQTCNLDGELFSQLSQYVVLLRRTATAADTILRLCLSSNEFDQQLVTGKLLKMLLACSLLFHQSYEQLLNDLDIEFDGDSIK